MASKGSCKETRETLQSSCLQLVQVKPRTGQIWCNVSWGAPWPLVPLTFRKAVFVALHNLAHPDIIATKRLIVKQICVEGDGPGHHSLVPRLSGLRAQ